MKPNINTSAEDILSSFRCSIEKFSIKGLEEAKLEEIGNRNRTTVIKLLNRAIRDKKNGARRL